MFSDTAVRAMACLSLLCLLLSSTALPAADWPMGRHDGGRTAASPQELPAELRLQWVREYPPLKPAWPDHPKMQFDAAYDPIVLGKTMFVGSSRTDSVTALDTETGREKWTFATDGPVRFAPVAWEGRIYLASDDGYLYCVEAGNGSLVWKFRGGPSERKVLGNERLISTWPARGAPVIADSTVYFAAGIWPFMGVFVHALDARTGAVVWTNSGDGSLYMKQPHNADSFAGIAPQGALAIADDKLLIPCGRSVPACYDRKTGKMLHYRLAENSKLGGGTDAAALGNLFVNGGAAFDVTSGDYLGTCGNAVVLTPDALYSCSRGVCEAHELKISFTSIAIPDRKGNLTQRVQWPLPEIGSVSLPGVTSLIQAGSHLYAGMPNQLTAISLPLQVGQTLAIAWQATIEGTPLHLLAADDRLFAVTREGKVYCFGSRQVEPKAYPWTPTESAVTDVWTAKARTLLDTTRVREGYCIAWGIGSGRLITELARQSRLHIIVVDGDAVRVGRFRKEMIAAGLYGERVAVVAGNPLTVDLPPYLAGLMVSEDLADAGIALTLEFLQRAFHSLRPYGGVACWPLPSDRRREFPRLVAAAHLAQAMVREVGEAVWLSREGALPGSADWTHEHADASNTRVSKDRLVKAPLGVLWFGGPSQEGTLPRHGHGPQPQVIDGRLIVEGVDMLRAIDIYTGRLLWTADLAGVGKAYNITSHQPGANASGTNYISTPDGIYVASGRTCLRLDPATGQRLMEIHLPTAPGLREPPTWAYLNVCGEFLIGGGEPYGAEWHAGRGYAVSGDAHSSSTQLVVMDRHTGAILWMKNAQVGFRNNAICAGGGRLYCIDRLSSDQLARLRHRGEEPHVRARLLALDLRTGRELWSTDDNVFGTWLSYSAERDVLVEAGRVARDSLPDEPKGMRAFRAGSGAVLWHNRGYAGPAMIHGDIILKDTSACDLLTGAPKLRDDPLTGKPVEWTWSRNYGCNTPAASEHLLTFRSGAAGYYDLCHDGGTGNLGGFRSSCTNNLIVAGGLLNAPDYTRTCTCSYQIQTSLALIHTPDAEMWTYFTPQQVQAPVRRVGINFGAPGDRKADDGTLWLDYPKAGGPAPQVPIKTVPEKPATFRHHASEITGDDLKWVDASGVKGLRTVTIGLGKQPEQGHTYTVRLHFSEPERLRAGQRVFTIGLQGKQVLRNLDIAEETGGPHRGLVKEFKGILVKQELTVTLTPSGSSESVLCGVEIVAEGW